MDPVKPGRPRREIVGLAWHAFAACLLAMVLAGDAWPRARIRPPAPVSAAAAALYREGVLPDGGPLRGERAGGEPLQGRAAACVNCHRRSGLGMIEGETLIPPITGEYLFHPAAPVGQMSAHTPGAPARRAYTEATLARALREGVNPDGREIGYLMPRFALDDATIALLTGYLKQLSLGPVPGVSLDSVQFATIVTPDADPVASRAMLSVLEKFFGTANTFYHGESPPLQYSPSTRVGGKPRWQLHVWTLSGPPESWEAQLHERLRREPVFAVLSGISGRTWEPVHRFCESESIPCLLPNVDLPVVAEQDFYPVYYSKGVLLEAALIATALQSLPPQERPHQVMQVYAQDDIGADAAAALQALAAAEGLETVNRPLKAGAPSEAVRAALAHVDAHTAVVLWLRGPDLERLRGAPPESVRVFVSGIMGGLENAPLSKSWRAVALMAYPYELPNVRVGVLDYPLGWFRFYKVPVIDERVQVDTYVACSLLVEAFKAMHNELARDYLIERFEATLAHTVILGFYSHLGLGPGQRFASKGGYLVRFTDPTGTKLTPTTDWIVP